MCWWNATSCHTSQPTRAFVVDSFSLGAMISDLIRSDFLFAVRVQIGPMTFAYFMTLCNKWLITIDFTSAHTHLTTRHKPFRNGSGKRTFLWLRAQTSFSNPSASYFSQWSMAVNVCSLSFCRPINYVSMWDPAFQAQNKKFTAAFRASWENKPVRNRRFVASRSSFLRRCFPPGTFCLPMPFRDGSSRPANNKRFVVGGRGWQRVTVGDRGRLWWQWEAGERHWVSGCQSATTRRR